MSGYIELLKIAQKMDDIGDFSSADSMYKTARLKRIDEFEREYMARNPYASAALARRDAERQYKEQYDALQAQQEQIRNQNSERIRNQPRGQQGRFGDPIPETMPSLSPGAVAEDLSDVDIQFPRPASSRRAKPSAALLKRQKLERIQQVIENVKAKGGGRYAIIAALVAAGLIGASALSSNKSEPPAPSMAPPITQPHHEQSEWDSQRMQQHIINKQNQMAKLQNSGGDPQDILQLQKEISWLKTNFPQTAIK